jgi:hypothetical protein
MADEKHLAREALKANGLTQGEASEKELEILERQIAHRRKWRQRLKWCTYGALGLFILLLPFTMFVISRIDPNNGVLDEILGVSQAFLFNIGLVSAGFYWVRSYGISRMEVKANLARITLQLEKLTRQSEQSDDS